jgi:hypothetical protein
MTNSGLIVFLPLVGAILGAVIGGFVGAYANSRSRDREVKKADDRECKGLLYLVDGELYFNETRLTRLKDDPRFIIWTSLGNLRSDNWDSGKARLAQLVAPDHMKILNT